MKNKKIKLLILDFDGTLVNYPVEPFRSSWDALSLALPPEKQKEWVLLRGHYIKFVGDIKVYSEWFSKQTNLLKGLSIEKVRDALFPVPYSKGAEEFYKNLNGEIKKGILSSGLDFVANKVREELKLDFSICSIIHHEAGKFTGKGKDEIGGLYGKVKWLKKISGAYRISLGQTAYVGDSFNDFPVFDEVGLAIGFNPKTFEIKKEMEKRCSCIIYDHRDLSKILA